MVCTILAAGLGLLAWQDFRSARRQYEATRLAAEGNYGDAARMTVSAACGSLDLVGRLELSWSTARAYDLAAEQSLEHDPVQARGAALAGLGALDQLHQRSPGFAASYWLEGRLRLQLARAAAAEGRDQDAPALYQAAANAFAKQLLLNPYHAQSIEMLLLDSHLWPRDDRQAAMLLCGWMRYGRLNDNWRAALAALLGARPEFAATVTAMAEEAKRLNPHTPEQWPDPLIPERFGLAAQVALLRGDAPAARHYYLDLGLPFLHQIEDQFAGITEIWEREIQQSGPIFDGSSRPA